MTDESNSLNELFAALAKAQAKLKAVPFDSKNPHFNNEFASLTAIQDATRNPLAKQGLTILQILETIDGDYWLHTILGHASGQSIKSSIKLLMARNDMQSLGSATTYAKRYAWQAIIGVSGDQDDDGNAAIGKPAAAQQLNRQPPKIAPPAQASKPSIKNEAPATKTQLQHIKILMTKLEIEPGDFSFYLKYCYPGVSSENMKKFQADDIVAFLEDPNTTVATLIARGNSAQKLIENVESHTQ